MLAHHPTTGAPIRIIKSDAQISQEDRTLVWVRPTFQTSSRWSRWSTIVTEPAALTVLDGHTPTIAIIRDVGWAPHVGQLGEACILIASKAMKEHTTFAAAGEAFASCLELEELYELYPFLGQPVTAEDSDAKLVVSVAHILRFRAIAWQTPTQGDAAAQVAAWLRCCKGRLIEIPADGTPSVIPELWLIQQYFKHPRLARAREIHQCLERNVANPYIDRILLLNETDEHIPLVTSDKIVCRNIGHRLTYADALRAIQTDLPAGAIAVFANADIWLDDTIKAVWSLAMEERRLFLALLRWEEDGTIFGPRADSQDTWIVAKSTVDFAVTDEDFGFTFGKPGCDNAVALAMLRKRCLVANPAYTIHTHHVHASQVRNYDSRDVLYKPAYLYLDPTAIQAYSAVTQMTPHLAAKDVLTAWRSSAPKQSIHRPLHALRDEVGRTIRRMISMKEGGGMFENTWTPTGAAGIPLYEFKGDVFVTREGLVSDFQSIYLGAGHREWRTGWENSQISSLTPAYHVPAVVAIPVPATCWTNVADWVLSYMPTVLRIRDVVAAENVDGDLPEFVIPTDPQVAEFIYHSVWKHRRVGTIPYMENAQIYSNHVWAVPELPRLSAEDVGLLRSLLPPAQPKSVKRFPHIVFCVSDDAEHGVITEGWVQEVIQCHKSLIGRWRYVILRPSDGFLKRREAFREATWIVGQGEVLKWIWMATPDTKVLDYMPESEISSTIPHLAGAASLFYIPTLVRKEPVEFQRQHALVEFGEAIRQHGFTERLFDGDEAAAGEKPLVVIPTGVSAQGMWAHAGDTFREMAEMWAERGYCRLQRSEETPYCWWGGVGEVLLYDRPTPRWWPAAEIMPSYQMAMFGNCAPPGPPAHLTRQSVWSFWPRSPRALEAVAAKGPRTWEERPIVSLFLGKVENGVQQKHRCAADWSAAVELFSMPVDPTGAPYPYTQSQYLEKVSNTRWGLCLPGYGPKCNREIEYMALGTVPIVTEGVDMRNYLVPPQEGVHYLRATTPADVKRIVATTPKETWERMSAACHRWWRENASAEGLFRLTWGRVQQTRPYWGVGMPPWKGTS
jgi:hypothetical protein